MSERWGHWEASHTVGGWESGQAKGGVYVPNTETFCAVKKDICR